MAQKILPFVIMAMTAALIGCPPPAPQSITILDPKDLEAHDIDLASEFASIEISIDLTSSSGQALQEGSFWASMTEDLPGVGPEDVDEQGNPIEQPINITAYFAVDYQAETATLSTPIELPMGWYFLEAQVRDVQNVVASDLVVFSVDYPGPLFVGSTNSPYNSMLATLSGMYDECFNGVLADLWSDTDALEINNVPTFLEVKARPLGLPVHVEVPPMMVPGGILTVRAYVVNNAMLFPPKAIDPIDLFPWTNGLVPCEIGFDFSGVFRRTGTETAAPRFVLQNVTVANSPSGGRCWLNQPPAGCQGVVDMQAVARYPVE